MGLLDEAVPSDEVPKHLVTVLYGPPGVGKTIASARTANKTLLVTDENAHVSLTQFPEISKTVSIIQLKSFDHLNGIIMELYKGDHDYDHFMIDTFDGVVRMKLKEQRQKVDFKRGHRDINSLEDYNLLNNHMFDLIARLTKLPISVTLTSHDRIPDQQSFVKGDRLLRPSIPFRIFECLNGYANVVGYMSMRKIDGALRRTIALQANDEFEAKNHLNMKSLVSDDTFVDTIRNWKGI
ncbi:AAA family ATPase [Streptomyces sp. NPDC012769]|uniref:AAA family ATPase n=1 Tax=Streptomyces sp. NPDC012769 TaxID=3364848 RepID=UPI0036807898